jgi:uncharacterized protein (TIGR02145 family)
MKHSIFIIIILVFIFASCKKEKTEPNTLTDSRDGQIYKTVKIGDQVWMDENLNYYTPTGSWYFNNDSIKYAELYGRQYNWNTMMNGENQSNEAPSGVQGICPNGWHIPSDAEWLILVDYMATLSLHAADLKESGNEHWKPGYEGTNSTGFTALPSGYMAGSDSWYMGSIAYFHSCTKSIFASIWILDSDKEDIIHGEVGYNITGCVRCLKNK